MLSKQILSHSIDCESLQTPTDSLSSSDVVHTIGTHPNDSFHSTGGTVDDTPIFLLALNVHCSSLVCANYKIRFNFTLQLFTLEVIVAQIENLALLMRSHKSG